MAWHTFTVQIRAAEGRSLRTPTEEEVALAIYELCNVNGEAVEIFAPRLFPNFMNGQQAPTMEQ